MSAASATATPVESLPRDPQTRVNQTAEQLRLAMGLQGEPRLATLRRAIQLNPYAFKARYLLAVGLLQSRQLASARRVLNELAQWLPDHAPLKFYRAVAAIQDAKKGDLEEAENLLKELEKAAPPELPLTLGRLELALRRKKNRPPVADWLHWLDRIPVNRVNIPLVADKCAKFFMERDEPAEGDQVLAWLDKTWRVKFAGESLIAVLPYLHHIKYWPKDRWSVELQEEVFDEAAADLVCLFVLEKIRRDERGAELSEDKQLAELRTLMKRLPGVSSLAYNYLALLNAVAKKRLLTDGDAEGALVLWRESVKLDRFDTLVQFNMALAEARQGRTKDFYIHWQSALRLALWRWELGGNRSDWDLCAARAQATAAKLREEIEASEREKQDVPPAKIIAWLNYLDLYALLRQLAFDHPYHQLGVSSEAAADEARRVAQVWQARLTAWEAGRAGHSHVPSQLIPFARARFQSALTARSQPPTPVELSAFQDYCEQRANHARDIFYTLAYLIGLNRFEEARDVMDRLTSLPLTTLAPFLAKFKVQSDEGEISFAELINVKELAARAGNHAVHYAEFLAEEGDDQELIRQMAQLDTLPWKQLDKPAEARRKARERMAFAVLDPAFYKAFEDRRWDDAIPAVEVALRRLPDQLDLLWLAALTLFRSVDESFGQDEVQVQWSGVRAKLQQAANYCQRTAQVAPADEVAARMGDLGETITGALKVATEMETPHGQALRRARTLLKQEQWTQAYQVLSQLPAKERNAEVEFYLGLALHRQINSELGEGQKRPSLSDLQSRLEKAAGHLRSAKKQASDKDLIEATNNLLEVITNLLDQVKRAQVRESAIELMNKERWNDAHSKLSGLSKPDAETLFYMAVCRYRRVMQEFEQATPSNRPSVPQAIKSMQQALDHIRDARRSTGADDLKEELTNLEEAVRRNLNILKTA